MKKVFGFKVLVNDKIICRAGLKNNSVVTCILDSVRRKEDNSEELSINIGGLDIDNEKYVKWFDNTLQEGDKISIEVITDTFDVPTSIRDSPPHQDSIERKIEHFYKLKEELKDYLTE